MCADCMIAVRILVLFQPFDKSTLVSMLYKQSISIESSSFFQHVRKRMLILCFVVTFKKYESV
jgi:hypothetical protein